MNCKKRQKSADDKAGARGFQGFLRRSSQTVLFAAVGRCKSLHFYSIKKFSLGVCHKMRGCVVTRIMYLNLWGLLGYRETVRSVWWRHMGAVSALNLRHRTSVIHVSMFMRVSNKVILFSQHSPFLTLSRGPVWGRRDKATLFHLRFVKMVTITR